MTASRRGDTVELTFVVPASNTDQTRPANIERIDIYALTTTARLSDQEIVKRGERVASVEVKAPRDPNRTIDPGRSGQRSAAARGLRPGSRRSRRGRRRSGGGGGGGRSRLCARTGRCRRGAAARTVVSGADAHLRRPRRQPRRPPRTPVPAGERAAGDRACVAGPAGREVRRKRRNDRLAGARAGGRGARASAVRVWSRDPSAAARPPSATTSTKWPPHRTKPG